MDIAKLFMHLYGVRLRLEPDSTTWIVESLHKDSPIPLYCGFYEVGKAFMADGKAFMPDGSPIPSLEVPGFDMLDAIAWHLRRYFLTGAYATSRREYLLPTMPYYAGAIRFHCDIDSYVVDMVGKLRSVASKESIEYNLLYNEFDADGKEL